MFLVAREELLELRLPVESKVPEKMPLMLGKAAENGGGRAAGA